MYHYIVQKSSLIPSETPAARSCALAGSWCGEPLKPVLRRQKPEDRMFEAALDHILSKGLISGLQNKTVLSTQSNYFTFQIELFGDSSVVKMLLCKREDMSPTSKLYMKTKRCIWWHLVITELGRQRQVDADGY